MIQASVCEASRVSHAMSQHRASQLATVWSSAAYRLVALSSSHQRSSPPQLARCPACESGDQLTFAPTQQRRADEKQDAAQRCLQQLAPAVLACKWTGFVLLVVHETAPRSRGSRRSFNSAHSASAHQQISVQAGRARAQPPTPCLTRTPSTSEQAHAPQHSTNITSVAQPPAPTSHCHTPESPAGITHQTAA